MKLACRFNPAVTLAIAAWAGPAAAADLPPRFRDFPAAALHITQPAPVRLDDAHSRTFATRLREGASRPANFAGAYVLTAWGCGASCVTVAAIHRGTGAVAWLPFTVCCWRNNLLEPLEYRLDSRLVVVNGMRNEAGSNGTSYYKLDGGRFVLVRDARP